MASRIVWVSGPLLALVLTACAASEHSEAPVEPRVVGGWQSRSVDAQAQAAADFALRALNRPGTSLKSLDSVEVQVVAGLNYKLALTLTDGSRWQVVVYRDLQSNFSLTSASQRP